MVNESSVNFPQYKFENIALQMLSKIGNVPWVLEKELDYCDKIMGGDISRKKKSKSRGTMNHMGVPRWYKSNGDFFKYRIIDAQLEGERIPM